MRSRNLSKSLMILGLTTASSVAMAGQTEPYGLALVQANLVSDGATGNQKVCIIGTGYDINHEDLMNGTNVTGDVSNTLSMAVDLQTWDIDSYGQGTHAAGVISALDNGIGVKGVNPGGTISLHNVKVVHKSNWWPYIGTGMGDAVALCQAAGANIIHMGMDSDNSSAAEELAMQVAYDSGILLIGAGGNRGNSTYRYPASYDSVMGIGAVDIQNQAWRYSNNHDKIELVAAGSVVNSTTPNNSYSNWDGTNASSAYVAGVAALVWSQFPDCDNLQIRNALQQSALDLGDAGLDNVYGHGLVQAKDAVDYLTANSCTSGGGGSVEFIVVGVELTEANSRIVELSDGNTIVVWTEVVEGKIQLSYQLFTALGESVSNKTVLDRYQADSVINDVIGGVDGGFQVVLAQGAAPNTVLSTLNFDQNGALIVNQPFGITGAINAVNEAVTKEMIGLATGTNWSIDPVSANFADDSLITQSASGLRIATFVDAQGESVTHKVYQHGRNGSDMSLVYQGAGGKELIYTVTPQMASEANSYLSESIAVDGNGNPHVVFSYIDKEAFNGSYAATQRTTYYAYRDNQGWHVKAAPSLEDGHKFSLAVDAQGTAHVAYYTYQGNSYYGYFDGTQWQKSNMGVSAQEPVLVMNNSDEPVVIYNAVADRTLSTAVPVIVSSSYTYMDNTVLPFAGMNHAGAYDSTGRLHISSAKKTSNNIQHSVFDGTTWVTQDVASTQNAYAAQSDIVINANDVPSIGYLKGIDYPIATYEYHLADKASGTWDSTFVYGPASMGDIDMALDVNDKPILALYGYQTFVQSYWAGWRSSYSTSDVLSDFWLNFGYTQVNPTGYLQAWRGVIVVSTNTETPAPKVESNPYIIATGTYDSDYYMRFDATGQFVSRMPSAFDSVNSMKPGVVSNIDFGSLGVTVGDFDNDGLTDYITGGEESVTGDVIIEFHKKVGQSINVFASAVNTPTLVVNRPALDSISLIGDFASADFNKDGNLDFVMTEKHSANVHLYLGNGDGTFQTSTQVAGIGTHSGIDTEDVNGDGNPDFVASSYFNTWKVEVFLGDGAGNFAVSQVVLGKNDDGHNAPPGITLSDFDNDGLVDAVLTNYSGNGTNANGLALYKGNGDGTFVTTAQYFGPQMGVALTSNQVSYRNVDNAYINDDAFMDVIVSDTQGKAIRVYLGTVGGQLVHKDQHFATNPEVNTPCGGAICLLDVTLTEMADHIDLYRSDAPKGLSTPAYSQLSAPN